MADSILTDITAASVPALDDTLYGVDVSDTTDDPAGSSRQYIANRLLGMLNHVCCGRLTLESGVPVSATDQTAKTNVYFTPYEGRLISLYDGTRWTLYSFSELTLALGTLTSGKNYDVFIYDNSGTLTLELSAAWTTDTARADALATQDGVYVKSGAATRRHLGTIRTTSTTTTEDSGSNTSGSAPARRFVWNRYNQQHRPLKIRDSTANWTYTTAAFRPWNNSTNNRVEVVNGDIASRIVLTGMTSARNSSSTPAGLATGFGYDSTSVVAAQAVGYPTWSGNNEQAGLGSQISMQIGLGYHYIQPLEYSAETGTSTWFGQTWGSDALRGCSGFYLC